MDIPGSLHFFDGQIHHIKMASFWRSSREVWGPYRLQAGLSAVGSSVLTPALAVTNVSAIGYIRCFAAAFPSKQSWEKTEGDMDHIWYPLVMTNSSPWYRWPIEIDGLPITNGWIFPWRTVSHNQMVIGMGFRDEHRDEHTKWCVLGKYSTMESEGHSIGLTYGI